LTTCPASRETPSQRKAKATSAWHRPPQEETLAGWYLLPNIAAIPLILQQPRSGLDSAPICDAPFVVKIRRNQALAILILDLLKTTMFRTLQRAFPKSKPRASLETDLTKLVQSKPHSFGRPQHFSSSVTTRAPLSHFSPWSNNFCGSQGIKVSLQAAVYAIALYGAVEYFTRKVRHILNFSECRPDG